MAQKPKVDPHVGRLGYLQALVTEFQETESQDAKEQVLANLANFAYDPNNYQYLRQLQVLDLFLDSLSEENETLVEFAIAQVMILGSWNRPMPGSRAQCGVCLRCSLSLSLSLCSSPYLSTCSLNKSFFFPNKYINKYFWGTWVAQVMISGSWDRALCWAPLLSGEPASPSPSVCCSPCLCSLCQINK
ncbi:armadillo repeat-containing protein 7 isoform X3 [Callorhinus ursinus]|uniref:armadillo repeat-containing protein 7 isoform X3 n=1 Tax=Callorhinus ursinus TaxID=34884 RepID=UPI003CCFFA4C